MFAIRDFALEMETFTLFVDSQFVLSYNTCVKFHVCNQVA